MHAVTGDAACRDKVQALVHGWGECVATDGYFFASEHPNAPHYIYDKMVGGLVDAWIHCEDAEALELLSRITDWALEHLSRNRAYAFNSGQGDTEWYTLTENLDRAWLATGDAKYRDFAAVWAYDAYWNLFPAHDDLFGPATGVDAYHAYSHVNTLGGARLALPRHGRCAIPLDPDERVRRASRASHLRHRGLRTGRTALAHGALARAARLDATTPSRRSAARSRL